MDPQKFLPQEAVSTWVTKGIWQQGESSKMTQEWTGEDTHVPTYTGYV